MSERQGRDTNEKWQITLLGGLTAKRGETEITTWRSVRMRSLLGYLALHPNQQHDREFLAEEIWGEGAPGQRAVDTIGASALLTQELSRLRKLFTGNGSDLILTAHGTCGLNKRLVETDVGRFLAALDQAERATSTDERVARLGEAVGIYRTGGQLLPGVHHEWVEAKRTVLAARLDAAEEELAELRRSTESDVDLDAMKERIARDAWRYQLQLHLVAGAALNTPEQSQWIDRLDAERQSCLAAIEWELQRDAVPRLLGSQTLRYVWLRRGRKNEMAEWLTVRLNTPGFVAPTPRPWLLSALATMNFHILGREALSRAQMQEAFDIFSRMGRRPEMAGSMASLAYCAYSSGEIDAWEEYSLHAEQLLIEIGHDEMAAKNRLGRARTYLDMQRYESGLRTLEDSDSGDRSLHGTNQQTLALLYSAVAHAGLGNFGEAANRLKGADAVKQDAPNLKLDIIRSHCWAEVAGLRGDALGVMRAYADATRMSVEVGEASWVVDHLGNLLDVLAKSFGNGSLPKFPRPIALRDFATLIEGHRLLAAKSEMNISPDDSLLLALIEARIAGRLGPTGMKDAMHSAQALTLTSAAALACSLFVPAN